MKTFLKLAVLIGLIAGAALCTPAQTPVPPPNPEYQPLNGADLDKLLGPIGLYPDPLIAEILPAATLPTQIVLADRYITAGGDPNQIDSQPWDPSVKALARYPTVLKYLDDNLNWTAAMGQAFLYQQDDVMNSIQRLRAAAQNYGNLQTTPQQQVIDDSGTIEIVPANPDLLYVPQYDPDAVYYETAGGPPFITFGIGWVVGGWLNCDFDWHHHHLLVWNHDHPRPDGWWHESGNQRDADLDRGGHDWHAASRPPVAGFQGTDRGWNNPGVNRSSQFSPRESQNSHPVEQTAPVGDLPRQTPFIAPQQRIIAPQQRFTAPQGNAFIGIQSPQDTRAFSTRGAESIQSMPHLAPPPVHFSAPAPHPSAPSGGGGGGHRH